MPLIYTAMLCHDIRHYLYSKYIFLISLYYCHSYKNYFSIGFKVYVCYMHGGLFAKYSDLLFIIYSLSRKSRINDYILYEKYKNPAGLSTCRICC